MSNDNDKKPTATLNINFGKPAGFYMPNSAFIAGAKSNRDKGLSKSLAEFRDVLRTHKETK